MIPQVVASERGLAQTSAACGVGVVGLLLERHIKLKLLESDAKEGESPVSGNCV
jgi:hypothetical protein